MRQLFRRSSRRRIIACDRSSVDSRSCSAVNDTWIACNVCGMLGCGAYVEADAPPGKPGVTACGCRCRVEDVMSGVPKSRTAGMSGENERGLFGLDSCTEPNKDGVFPPGRI